jgi:NAD(P)-dependent dehydrogenase (short-subunit alcohol dehydrogenase family)
MALSKILRSIRARRPQRFHNRRRRASAKAWSSILPAGRGCVSSISPRKLRGPGGAAKGGGAVPHYIPCDLRDIEALRRAVAEACERHGPVRVLINNAGNDERHTTESVSVEYWDNRMQVNLRHQFFAAQAVRPHMRDAGGGSIVNFGSITWLVGDPDCPAYVTAKAAIGGLTRALARELGPEKIRVNCVLPGWVMTERQVKLWLDEAGERQIADRQCLKEKLYPPDIARMVLFLAADDSRMCTSQNYIVDGGWV